MNNLKNIRGLLLVCALPVGVWYLIASLDPLTYERGGLPGDMSFTTFGAIAIAVFVTAVI